MRPLVVPIVLALCVRELSGRVMIRVKPPPSDRIWYGFYRLPKLSLTVEPVVSARAITWSLIHTLIMKRIHEALHETIVLPNMDDIAAPPLVYGELYAGEKPYDADRIPKTLSEALRSAKSREQAAKAAALSTEHADVYQDAISEPDVDLVMGHLADLASISSCEPRMTRSLGDSPAKFPESSRELSTMLNGDDSRPSEDEASENGEHGGNIGQRTSRALLAMRRSVQTMLSPLSLSRLNSTGGGDPRDGAEDAGTRSKDD